MSFAIKLSDILVFRNMPVPPGPADSCEIFPITINFVKSISDKKLQQLAALAKWVQDNEEDIDTVPMINKEGE